MSIFGDLERLIADLYPYRWPLTVGFVVAVAIAAWFAYVRDWHLPLLRHKLATSAAVVALIAVAVPAGNYLLSPLWERSFLDEPSPLAAASTSPTGTPLGVVTPAVSDAATATPAVGDAVAVTPAAVAATPVADARPTDTPRATDAPGANATPVPADPTSTAAFEPRIVRRGTVTGADDFPFGEGTALLIEISPGRYSLRLEEFSVRNGPDLFIYLSPGEDGYLDGAINLGELRATDGAFNYEIPRDIDIDAFNSAVVWCRQFSVEFASAPLVSVATN